MTREEAINVLKKYDVYGCGVCLQDDFQNNLDATEALNMAIEALSAERLYTHEEVWADDDLISRADVQDLIAEILSTYLYDNQRDILEHLSELVEALSSVSVNRPSGEWIKVDEQPYFRKHYHKVCCSICHHQGNEKDRYCSNCGAIMKSGGE